LVPVALLAAVAFRFPPLFRFGLAVLAAAFFALFLTAMPGA
jgi:hypothetical protein